MLYLQRCGKDILCCSHQLTAEWELATEIMHRGCAHHTHYRQVVEDYCGQEGLDVPTWNDASEDKDDQHSTSPEAFAAEDTDGEGAEGGASGLPGAGDMEWEPAGYRPRAGCVPPRPKRA